MSAETGFLNDEQRMREAVIFDGATRGRKLSRFWILLVLASVIAAAGVVGDSTATVIGAMIVAPMMLPIQGTMLSAVLGDQRNLVRSLLLVIAGAALAVAIGYLVGLLSPTPVVAATNSQVAARVAPRLIDLLAALGTGVVGSIALVRRDISDTLPGVAIAISLVPPLSVVGLTLESHAYAQSLGALLLFITNVAAILATGVVVMGIYRVRERATSPSPVGGRRNSIVAFVGLLVIVAVPLSLSTVKTSSEALRLATIQTTASAWAKESGWHVITVATTTEGVEIATTGSTSRPSATALEQRLRDAGIDPAGIQVDYVPTDSVTLDSPTG